MLNSRPTELSQKYFSRIIFNQALQKIDNNYQFTEKKSAYLSLRFYFERLNNGEWASFGATGLGLWLDIMLNSQFATYNYSFRFRKINFEKQFENLHVQLISTDDAMTKRPQEMRLKMQSKHFNNFQK